MMNKEDFLQDLNEQQKKAVFTQHHQVCVIAGPGCGKTRTLVNRAIYLLLVENIFSDSLVILTFTKKAIEEVRKRIEVYVSLPHHRYLNVFNFHSFCFLFLSKHSQLLGLNQFVVYDHGDQVDVMKRIAKKNDWPLLETKEINSVIAWINIWKNSVNFQKHEPSLDLEVDKNTYLKEYQSYLKVNGALDYNDLILCTIKLLENNKFLLQQYQKKFTNILVDEAQDMNFVQMKLVKLISSGSKQKRFLVGDANQSIYNFQGSLPEIFNSFIEDKEWEKIYLNVNYRSTKNIVALTNSFVRQNNHSMIENLLVTCPQAGAGPKVYWVTDWTSNDLIRQILFLAEQGVPLSEIAVLYRNNYLSGRIEQNLLVKKIPYETLGSFKFIEREEIKDCLAFFRTVVCQDDISLLRVLKLQESIGEAVIEKIDYEKVGKLFDHLKNGINEEKARQLKLTTKQKEKINQFITKINSWQQKVVQKWSSLELLLKEILNDFDYWQYLNKLTNSLDRKRNVRQLINTASNWQSNSLQNDQDDTGQELVNKFLQWFSIVFEDKKLLKSRENLILSTIHRAKGLEFRIVFLVYLDEGILPYRDSNLIEEKRLFYVGITRPKEVLYLLSKSYNYSSFLEEVDPNFLNKVKRLQFRQR